MTFSPRIVLCSAAIVLSLVIALGVQTLRLSRAETAMATLTADLNAKTTEAERWQALATSMQKSADALEAQAQSCLKREAAARADADAWRELLEEATTRDMDETEHKGVPDDATRRALTDALDNPL